MAHLTDWFHDAKWGVFIHFTAQDEWSANDWNRRVDAFDVEGLASQLAVSGVGYLFLTTGQNSGHFCAPNETYDRIVGINPSKLSRRDLISDMADALKPHGIRLMVYHPSGAPERDPVAVERLKWRQHDYGTPGERLPEFQLMWEDVLRDWSVRWGDKVAGWWFDGVYFADAMYLHDAAPNFGSLSAAAKAGNPDALIAFNAGVNAPVQTFAGHEDYTAGEISYELPLHDGYGWREKKFVKETRWLDGSQYQILSFLGSWWDAEPLRFTDELAIGYTQFVTQRDGVMTWGIGTDDRGVISDGFMRQLTAIGAAVK
jgi:alpha-L-fucosidase